MNIVNKAILKLVSLPKGLYEKAGISVNHLTAILRYKLIMDDRRPSSIQQARQRKNKDKKVSNSSIFSILFSAFLGLMFLVSFVYSNDPLLQLTFYFAMFITMVCMMLVSDFTSVLIDVRDNMIILPKPVNDKTFVTARLLHIFIHICKIILPMSLPGLVYMGINSGFYGVIVFFLLIILATIFSIFLINAVYMLILRITTPDKFKNIIGNIQIVFAIIIYASYQILPRMSSRINGLDVKLQHADWLIIMPPYWFAAAFKLIYSPSLIEGSRQMVAGITGILLPWVSIYVVIKYLAPSFNQKLSMISGGGEEYVPTIKGKVLQKENKGFLYKIASFLTSGKTELAGFMFASRMMARSREFKMKVYPSLGYMLVMVFVMFFSKNNITLSAFQTDKGVMMLLFIIYILSLTILTATTQMMQSEKFKAAWVFFTTPIEVPGVFISGAIKAAISKFYLISASAISIVAIVLCGHTILPNLLLALSNQLVIIYILSMVTSKFFPFSRPMNNIEKGAGNLMRTIARLLISVLVAGIHILIFKNLLMVWIALPISFTLLYFLTKSVKEIGWKEIRNDMDNY